MWRTGKGKGHPKGRKKPTADNPSPKKGTRSNRRVSFGKNEMEPANKKKETRTKSSIERARGKEQPLDDKKAEGKFAIPGGTPRRQSRGLFKRKKDQLRT